MPYLSLKEKGQFQTPSSEIVEENATLILPQHQTRKAYFGSAERRRDVVFTPDMFIECDFCHGWLSFESGLALSFPMVQFDLMRYWDGRPLWFVCCERAKDGKGPGNPIWCVGFEILKDEDDEDSEAGEVGAGETLPDISGDVD
jgi:hypothetical protein